MMLDGETELERKGRAVPFARPDHVRDLEQPFRVSHDNF